MFDFLGKSVDVDLERDDQDIYKQLNEYILERSLGNQYPELVERYWDYARNKVSPFNISSHSNDKHYFIVDGVPSKRIVNNAVKTFVKKGRLFKSKTNGYKKNSKSLQQMFPEFVEIYWDFENNTISPDEVKPYSNKDVYLLIDGKSVLRSINTAVRSFGKGSKQKRFISLEEKYPNFVKNHWDFEKNIIKPNEIAYGSHKEVYLIFEGQSKKVKLFTRNHSMKD